MFVWVYLWLCDKVNSYKHNFVTWVNNKHFIFHYLHVCMCVSVHIYIHIMCSVFDLQMMVRQHFVHLPKC